MTLDPRVKPDTIATHAGRHPAAHGGSVSPPVDRAATRIFTDLAEIEAAHAEAGVTGRLSAFLGSRGADQVAEAIAALEGPGAVATLTSSGMSALAITFLAFLGQGDHLLLPDTVFGPTRDMARDLLGRMGISFDLYHPLASEAEFRACLRPNTRMVLTESPGSNTFEVQDVPMIARVAHEAGALVAIDNSWATPLLFAPLAHGVDLSICAATKYLAGHSDLILGTIAGRRELMTQVMTTQRQMGDTPGADDAWLLARGLRTLPLRLRQHDASGRRIATALQARPEVRQVLHPALPDAAGHALWARDFTGATGLFGVVLDPLERPALEAFLGALRLFTLGYSWGGFESLILPVAADTGRQHLPMPDGTLLRLHVGLEDPDDLLADLDAAFAALPKA
ncbi:cystathionine beta-lyase [Pararhodobacter sp. CCB-MM2]|uniref:cystathionine beta-lyase n=1 Tax=Pararhodobacter sp. CCB-MM2 TaxID=1786003 RepID=UPI000B2A4251|nr:cystathionine beta-lyase [Pararhodobacter sp. CCB-MM2]